MLTLRFFDELGEQTRNVDQRDCLTVKDYQYTRLIYVPNEAIFYDKETRVIHFCAATISEALERIQQ